MEDDATNRVMFYHCEIVHKYISSSNCVKKRQHLSGDLLEIGKGRAGGWVGVLVNDISQVAPSNI